MDTCLDDTLKLDYLNGLLSGKDGALFEEHLAACPGCRREIDELRNMVTAVSGLPRPSVPAAWPAAVKDRLKTERPFPVSPAIASPVPVRRKTNVFQYGVIASGVIAVVSLLLWLVLEGTAQRWLPGLSAASLGIFEPRAARTIDLVALILSLHALIFVPSIIDNIYQLVRRRGSKIPRGASAGFFAC